MISVSCTCGRRFKAEDHHAGKRTRCPVCGNLLVIGQAPAGPSGVNDNGEVPSWWFPTSSTSKAGSGSTSRSGSNPDDIQTVILPPKPSSHTDAPGTPLGPARPGTGGSKWLIGILGGVALVAIVGLVLVAWPRQGGNEPQPGPDLPANRGPLAQDKTKEAGSGGPPSPVDGPNAAPGSLAGDGAVRQDGPSSPAPAEATVEPPRRAAGPRLQLLIPAYFYPGGDSLRAWQRVIEAAARVPIVTIANPGNGPGEQRNPDYFLITKAASDKGVRVVGYVTTSYAKRPLTEVKNEIDRWIEFYPDISGFFFDQQSSSDQNVEYYVKARDHARLRIKAALIITNPGSLCSDQYFARGVADVTCVFANFQGFAQFDLPGGLKSFGPNRFAALVYNVPTATAMHAVVKDALAKGIGYLYVGDSPRGDNPYGKLPDYWDEAVETISRQK
jgi:hypothetical protein